MGDAGNSDTGGEDALSKQTSPLPPPSPTGYEHFVITSCDPDDDSKPAQFNIQSIYYLPSGPPVLPLNTSVISALTEPQRDVLYYILEDRNGRTERDGRWALAGLRCVRERPDEEISKDFEISIMFFEYRAPVDRRLKRSKRPHPSMASDGHSGKARTQERRDSGGDGEKEEMTGARMDKGKQAVGREYASMSQGWRSSPPAPKKDVSLGFSDNPKIQGNIPSQRNDQILDVGEVQAKDSGQDTKPSGNLRPPTWRRDNCNSGRPPKSETVSLPSTHQTTDDKAESSASLPSPATIQTAALLRKASSAMSDNRATASAFSQQNPSQGSQQTQKQLQKLPRLTPAQLANIDKWAWDLRKEGFLTRATFLFRIVWYCREILIGPLHPWTISTIRQLAVTYDASGQNDMAANVREVLKTRNSGDAIGELAEPAPAPTVTELFEAHQLALELRRQGVLDWSISLFTIVWYAWELFRGGWSGNLRTTLNELALTYDANGQPDVAKRLREELAERKKRK